MKKAKTIRIGQKDIKQALAEYFNNFDANLDLDASDFTLHSDVTRNKYWATRKKTDYETGDTYDS